MIHVLSDPCPGHVPAWHALMCSEHGTLKNVTQNRTFRYAEECLNPCELIPIVDPPHSVQFYKLWDMLGMFEMKAAIEKCAGPKSIINTAHLCEAPGSFIKSVMELWPSRVDWRAISLKTIGAIDFFPDLIGESRRNGRMRVGFGADETGDITVLANAHRFAVDVGYASIDFVTVDGYNVDESKHARLLACELYASLTILKPEGCLIARLSDVYEEATINIIGILCSIFDQCAIVRSMAGQFGSADRYIMCRGLRQHTPQYTTAIHSFEYYGYNNGSHVPKVDTSSHVLSNIYRSSIEMCALIRTERARINDLASYMTAMGLTTPDAITTNIANLLKSDFKQTQATDFIRNVKHRLGLV